jgi:membrane associated rhomboid family serine protease
MIPAAVGFQCRSCVSTAAKKSRHPLFLAEGRTPYLTYALIAVNAVAALMGLATSAWAEGELGTVGLRGGLLGGGIDLNGNQVDLTGVDAGEWYRIFTGAFIHAGPVHLGFNMLVLWQVGMLLEPALGHFRFALLYTVAVLGGSFGALLLAPDTITIGASGGVFGVMGALFVVQRSGLLGARSSAVGFLIVVNLVLTFAVPRISIGGHVGGSAGASVELAVGSSNSGGQPVAGDRDKRHSDGIIRWMSLGNFALDEPSLVRLQRRRPHAPTHNLRRERAARMRTTAIDR